MKPVEKHARACKRKKPYRTYEQAEAGRLRRPVADELVVYQCLHCWQWHLGHMSERHLV